MDLARRGAIGAKTGNPRKSAAGKAHMAAVAQLPCVICGAWPVSAHHCFSGRYGTRKAPDTETIPLCWNHHQGPDGIHTNKTLWESLHGPDTGYLPAVRAMLTQRGL